jgi:hypothetical protein
MKRDLYEKRPATEFHWHTQLLALHTVMCLCMSLCMRLMRLGMWHKLDHACMATVSSSYDTHVSSSSYVRDTSSTTRALLPKHTYPYTHKQREREKERKRDPHTNNTHTAHTCGPHAKTTGEIPKLDFSHFEKQILDKHTLTHREKHTYTHTQIPISRKWSTTGTMRWWGLVILQLHLN